MKKLAGCRIEGWCMKKIHELSDEYRNFSGYDPSPTVVSNRTDRLSEFKEKIEQWRDSFHPKCDLIEVCFFFPCRENFKLFADKLGVEIQTNLAEKKVYCDWRGIRFLPYFPGGRNI